MTKTSIRFKAKLFRPAMEPARPLARRRVAKAARADQQKKSDDSWTFLILPKNASAKLPSRGMTPIEGTINGVPFQAVVEPDGQKSHWLRVKRKLSQAAGADAGDIVRLDRTRGEGTRTRSTRRSEKSSRSRRSEGEKIVVGHHAKRAPGLDLLDHLSQAARDACAPDQECLLNARYRKATRMLLRYVWVLQQEHERS